jgi:para-aminobenzoate synthetase component 1
MTFEQRIKTIIDISPDIFRSNILSQTTTTDFILFDNWELNQQNIDWIIGWGKIDEFILSPNHSEEFSNLDQWINIHKDWKMGYINYDLKNILETNLEQKEKDGLKSNLIHFFVPEIIFIAKNNQVKAYHLPSASLPNFENKENISIPCSLDFKIQTNSEQYLKNINRIKSKIVEGDFYEINYCIEWQSDDLLLQAGQAYHELQQKLNAPFSCYFQLDNVQLLCNSPERFLKKTGNKIISQPIKGTQPRNQQIDIDLKNRNLLKSEKDLTENIMIVDLVRNDLSKIARKGSVKVSELAEIHTFNQVHQLISTVECELEENISFTDILKATFPMGSMTGVPKISMMNYAEEIETYHRDIYSGTVGYITPEGDFDFNVVIRSLINFPLENKSYIRAGGAITIDSDPVKEWEECLLKAHKILQFFE